MKPVRKFMEVAIAQSLIGMRRGEGGPFGAVIVQGEKVIARGYNRVLDTLDPTAHAEIVVIREACLKQKTFQLDGCDLYTSCEPCPMCLAAAYWARVDRIFFANTRKDAESVGFGDNFIYQELGRTVSKRNLPLIPFLRKEGGLAFKEWRDKPNKTSYGPTL